MLRPQPVDTDLVVLEAEVALQIEWVHVEEPRHLAIADCLGSKN